MSHWRDVMTRCDYLQGTLGKLKEDQIRAMDELECAGFCFLLHFGTSNAVKKRDEVQQAFSDGRLYEHLKESMGMDI